MIPKHIQKTIYDYLDFVEDNALLEIDNKSVANDLLDVAFWRLSSCTNCQHTDVYIDIAFPCNKNEEWSSAIKVTLRCKKLMKDFLVSQKTFGESTNTPGQYTFRGFCPDFDLFEEEVKENV